MEPLHGRIRDYAWGSRTMIAGLCRRPVPSPGPEAELWLGAHPEAPSSVRRDGGEASLLDVLAAEPARWLSEPVVARFGPRLPYLMKVLGADAPLSLQVHPDAEQARRGYAAQAERSDGPAGSGASAASAASGGQRNYTDPYHKPELLVALTNFDALCGFRDPAASAAVFEAFGVPELEPVVTLLRRGPAGLPAAVRTLLTWPRADRAGLVAAVVQADVPADFAGDAGLAGQLAARYPTDPGVLVALLLNHVSLAPGEAIWMPAGNPHAYLRGAGVEIMAASDNVLRGGLTPKHVDVPELLRILRFEVLREPVRPAVPVRPGVRTWPVPVDDFALHAVRLTAGSPQVRLAPTGPRVALCVAGEVVVGDRSAAVTLRSGDAAIGAADGGDLHFSGDGEVFLAAVGNPRSA